MAHHSSQHPLNPEHREVMKKLVEQFNNRTAGSDTMPDNEDVKQRLLDNLGATGEYPQGQFGPHDEGAIRLAVGDHQGKVIIDFGTAVRSIGFDPDQVDGLIRSLRNSAKRARR